MMIRKKSPGENEKYHKIQNPALPLTWTVIASIAILILLQCWRSHYFLTDDNLSFYLPHEVEIGRHLKAGENFFRTDYLFGGGYSLIKDPLFLSFWHPIYLAIDCL